MQLKIFEKGRNVFLLLFCVSLLVRLAFFIPVAANHTPVKYDEERYYKMAEGYSEVLRSFFTFQAPTSDSLTKAYGKGIWPPLHPIMLSLGMSIFGINVAIARLMMVILSALTAPFIFLLSRRVVPAKGAYAAAFIHIFYPGFVAYSHYLWPETTYIFMMTVAFLFCLKAVNTERMKTRILFSSLSGLFLGLSSLTKPVAWPNVLCFVIFFIVFFKIRWKALPPIAAFIVLFSLTITPWNMVISRHEKDDTFLSNTMGYYWFYGQNRWFLKKVRGPHHNGIGLPATVELTALVKDGIEKYGIKNKLDPAAAGKELALKEITGNIPAFIERSFWRLRELMNSDVIITRALQRADYPPVSQTLCGFLWLLIILSFIVFMFFIFWGFIGPPEGVDKRLKYLFILWALINIAPPVLVAAGPRYALPVLAFLLPFAGFGATSIAKMKKNRVRAAVTVVFSIPIVLNVLMLPKVPYPSSYYAPMINSYDSIRGVHTQYIDYVSFRADDSVLDDNLSISLNKPYEVFPLRTNTYRWHPKAESRMLYLDISSHNPASALEFQITSQKLTKTIHIHPLEKDSWNKWMKTGIQGLECKWNGAGFPYGNAAYIYRDLYRDSQKIPFILPVVLNSRENQKIYMIGTVFYNLPRYIRRMIADASTATASIKQDDSRTLSELFVKTGTEDIIFTGRKTLNGLLLDDKNFPAMGRDFSMLCLIPARTVSKEPQKRHSLMMIINNKSVLFKAFSEVGVRSEPLMPLKERIIWDTDDNYKFAQNLYILLFSMKMDGERVAEFARKLDDGKITKQELFSILSREAMEYYY